MQRRQHLSDLRLAHHHRPLSNRSTQPFLRQKDLAHATMPRIFPVIELSASSIQHGMNRRIAFTGRGSQQAEPRDGNQRNPASLARVLWPRSAQREPR